MDIARRLVPLILLIVFPLTGCYTYAPLSIEAVQPEAEVRAHLARSGTGSVGNGSDQPRSPLDGRVVRWDDEALNLAVWRADLRTGDRFRPQRQTLRISWSEIEVLEARRLSYWKTGALIGGLGAAMIVLLRTALDGEGGGDQTDPGDGGVLF